MMRGRQRDHRFVGLFLLLLLVGAEAKRVENEIEDHSYSNLTRIARKRAAARHRAERELGTFSAEGELHHSLEGLRLEAGRQFGPDDDDEVARGVLLHDGVWSLAILRSAPTPGSAILDTYPLDALVDKDSEDLYESRIHKRFVIYDDDFVGAAAKSGGHKLHVNCEVQSGKELRKRQRGKVKFSADPEDLSIRMKGNDKWLRVGGAGDVLRAWMKAIRILQTVGTCIENGSCLFQCTYLPQEEGCNSQEFCWMEEEDDPLGSSNWYYLWQDKAKRPRCKPRVGMADNLLAWDRLEERARLGVEEIEKTNCFVSCPKLWKYVNRKSQIAVSLNKQANDILRSPDADNVLPRGMASVLRTIVLQAPGIATEVALRMGVIFDIKRKTSTHLKRQLDEKGCSGLKDGMMQAVTIAALLPDDEPAAKQVQEYQEQCPVLASSGEAQQLEESAEVEQDLEEQSHGKESMVAKLIEAEESSAGLTQREERSHAKGSASTELAELEDSSSSMTQREEGIALVIILVLGAIALLSSVVGCFLVFSSILCSRSESFALQHCRSQYLGHVKSNCERDSSWGMFFLIAGIVLMVIVISLLVFSGLLGVSAASSGAMTWLTESLSEQAANCDIWGHLGHAGLVVAAYLWAKWTSAKGPPKVDDLKAMHEQEKMFRKCMAEMGEPMETEKQVVVVHHIGAMKEEEPLRFTQPHGDKMSDVPEE